jgi:glycosyltransferase involved in cell wall biosynthesis
MHALLARSFLEHGHDPLFWTIDAAGDTHQNLEILNGIPRNSILRQRLPGPARLAQLLRAWRPLRRLIGELQPDVVYASLDWANWLAVRASVGMAVPVVIGIPGGVGPIGWKRRIPDRLLARESPPAAMAAYSRDGLKAMRSKGIGAGIERIIPPGIDCDRFTSCAEKSACIRAELNIPSGGVLVGHVGRLHPVKDHPLLLHAFSKLPGQAYLLCVGHGDQKYATFLRKLAEQLGVADRVQWWPHRDDMPSIYSALDILVMPSISEGGPLVVAEAMACGTPCITSAVGAGPEFVGDLGIVLNRRTEDAIAEAILSLLESPPPTRACRQRMLEHFTLSHMTNATIGLLEQIV